MIVFNIKWRNGYREVGGGIESILLEVCGFESDECSNATTIYYGGDFGQDEALAYLSSLYASNLELLSFEMDPYSEMNRLYLNDNSLVVYHSEMEGFLFAYRREDNSSPFGDIEFDEGLWPYERSFDYDDRESAEFLQDAEL